ncbi:MAG: hypothetical protein ACR2GL_02515 [Thermoleophilaceae bacterium]
MPEHDDSVPEVDGELVAEVRHLPAPVDAPRGELDRPEPATLPATLAAATGGFVLGVIAFVLMKLLRRPAPARSIVRRRRRLIAGRRGPDVADTRSFLVDVHLLKR